jgi:hypothetical protein
MNFTELSSMKESDLIALIHSELKKSKGVFGKNSVSELR